MSIPESFKKLGVTTPDKVRKTRRLMIGTEGLTNSGKTEFLLSAPGPKIIVPIDPSYDSALDNPNPPSSRLLDGTGFDSLKLPQNMSADLAGYSRAYIELRERIYEIIRIPELVTCALDGDSDWWELSVLATYGRLDQITQFMYGPLYAVRRVVNKTLWESGKIIIGTNKLKDMYEDVLDENGNQVIDEKTNRPKQKKVAGEYKRRGFPDQDYLWQLQIRHLYKPPEVIDPSKLPIAERLKAKREGRELTGKTKPQWGLRIMKCKANPMLDGEELWGDKCNFKGLMELVYPQIPLEEWGFR